MGLLCILVPSQKSMQTAGLQAFQFCLTNRAWVIVKRYTLRLPAQGGCQWRVEGIQQGNQNFCGKDSRLNKSFHALKIVSTLGLFKGIYIVANKAILAYILGYMKL